MSKGNAGIVVLSIVLLSSFATVAMAAETPVNLGSAANFAALAGTTLTNVASVGTIINGDVGVSPGTAVTGFPPGVVTGTIHAGDLVAAQAQADLTDAYNDAAGRSTAPVTVSGNLGGQTLHPGLYKSTSSLEISSGDLTLDAQGDPNAVFIFQMASTLTTSSGHKVLLAGSAQAVYIFWQVGSSATLGTSSVVEGTILANISISLNTGATLDGRALARNGAVTLDSNSMALPVAATPTVTPTGSRTVTPTATPTIPPTMTPTPNAGYVLLDGFGGLHQQGVAETLFINPDAPYFGWDIARDVEILPDTRRAVLDGFGAVWTIGGGTPLPVTAAYFAPMDRAVAFGLTKDGQGYYMVDRQGIVYTAGDANPALSGAIAHNGDQPFLFPGTKGDVRAVEIAVNAQPNPADDSIYVLDSFGGVYLKGPDAATRGNAVRAFFGWDIARDLRLLHQGSLDAMLDGYGALHVSDNQWPVLGSTFFNSTYPYWFGFDIARAIAFDDTERGAYLLDGYGAAHARGNAPVIPGVYFLSRTGQGFFDIARDIEFYKSETPFQNAVEK